MQIILFENWRALPPPQTPPPLLRPSMPASVIVLNHLRTSHDPDTPLAIFWRGHRSLLQLFGSLCLQIRGRGCHPCFMIRLHTFSVFTVLFHQFHPHPFSECSVRLFIIFSPCSWCFFIIFYHSHSCSLCFMICHHCSSVLIIVHHFLHHFASFS